MATTTRTALMTGRELREILSLSRTSFHTRRALGKIGPQPVTTLGHPKWNTQEVVAWLNARDPAGELYDAATWPAAWKRLRNG